jgi:hypothetical protein
LLLDLQKGKASEGDIFPGEGRCPVAGTFLADWSEWNGEDGMAHSEPKLPSVGASGSARPPGSNESGDNSLEFSTVSTPSIASPGNAYSASSITDVPPTHGPPSNYAADTPGQSTDQEGQTSISQSLPPGTTAGLSINTINTDPHHTSPSDDLPPLISISDLALEAPPWLASAMLHTMVLIILALLLVPSRNFEELILRLDATERTGDDLLDDLSLSLDQTDFPIDQQILAPQPLDPTDQPLPSPVDFPSAAIPLGGLEEPTAQPIQMALSGREKGMQQALLNAYGGTAGTQSSVMEGLRWLARNQKKDGRWSLAGPYQDGLDKNSENIEVATAMALIAFQGAGYSTQTNLDDPFSKIVRRAWPQLLKSQDENGNFFRTGRGSHRLYTHAICTIALCELYGMTGDSIYREPAQRAIDYCVKFQSSEGGWRYMPGKGSDTSVTGWFVMALQSARMAGLTVPSATLARIGQYLDSVEHNGGRLYSYNSQRIADHVMTAEGLLCRQYLGWYQRDPRLQEGADLLLEYLPSWDEGKRNVYYWYYAAQVCHHLEGRHWRTWNRVMRKVLPANQINTGNERGSWEPNGDQWGPAGGRLTITCLSIYMLEVYYRHLPLYQLEKLSGL